MYYNCYQKNTTNNKPDSVLDIAIEDYHLSRLTVTSELQRPTLLAAITLRRAASNKIYLVFQPIGFIQNTGYPMLLCALTAHFHPYRYPER